MWLFAGGEGLKKVTDKVQGKSTGEHISDAVQNSSIQDTGVGQLEASGCGLQPENKEILPPSGPQSEAGM